ncbi:hypothetical protein L2E82_07655 [Cichorium intybus]|uniref:Uncharacterized protein n=1 Tax=Cichorium intybus TaxID=13427 RepID=A0ACB9G4R9_CICIN|nr:hypothetical protein L2E82_07655 [Cichorium intybus]
MASSSLGYRYKKEFTKMEKPYSHPLFDASSIESYSKLSNMNPKFLNGNHKLRSNLVFLHDEMEVQDHCNSSKKQKLNMIGMVPTNNLKTKNYTKFDQGSSKKTSNQYRFDLNVSPPGSNGDNASYQQEDLSSPSEQISHHSLTTKFEQGCGSQLILMSCLRCYLHVMVCDVNPECPKCFKGDCLLDMYRDIPIKKYIV